MNDISSVLIDSGGGWLNSPRPQYILFGKPACSIYSYQNNITNTDQNNTSYSTGDPLEELAKKLSEGFIALGYIGYDFPGCIDHRLKETHNKEGEILPESYFHFYRSEDVKTGSPAKLSGIVNDNAGSSGKRSNESKSNISREEYIDLIESARNYIANGDIYQINISQRFNSHRIEYPLNYSLQLYKNQPVPFFGYMEFPGFQLISGSMELFLEKKGRNIRTRPIKGTIKRSSDHNYDRELARTLRNNPKEQAENIMIVDLMRNDLGRICRYGTVKATRLLDIKKFSTLYQMESEIQGKLLDNLTTGDIIRSTFPPGSVTGAPKSRCIEIISELEPHRRGPYCGAIGIFYPNGDFTLSVAIRIVVNTDTRSIYWVGGGIVWDSDPVMEYEETILKAKAISSTMSVY